MWEKKERRARDFPSLSLFHASVDLGFPRFASVCSVCVCVAPFAR